MSDPDVSKYFPFAAALMAEFHAEAVFVMVIGGKLGSGAAPALMLNATDSAEARARNSRIVRSVVTMLELVAQNLERDIARSGMPLEAKQ